MCQRPQVIWISVAIAPVDLSGKVEHQLNQCLAGWKRLSFKLIPSAKLGTEAPVIIG
jgi:hypothetical protein